MQTSEKSLRYFALIALALTAGAVRIEEEMGNRDVGVFRTEPAPAIASAASCESRLDLAWLGDCTHPKTVLLARH